MFEKTSQQRLAPDRYWSALIESTPLGPLSILVSPAGVAMVEFAAADLFARSHGQPLEKRETAPPLLDRAVDQLRGYFEGQTREFSLPLDLRGLSDFSREVLLTAANIPYGRIRTYGSLAAAAGHPGAARAVGGVMRRNPVPLLIPCHRVVASDGSLHGYSGPGGMKTKSWLLEWEGHRVKDMRFVGGPAD